MRDALQKADFYTLSPGSGQVTDASPATLTVLRCGVVTTVSMYTFTPDQRTSALFSDLDSLVTNANKTRTSDKPEETSADPFSP